MITEEHNKEIVYQPIGGVKQRAGMTRLESILSEYRIPKNKFIREMGYDSDQFYYALNLKFKGIRKVDDVDIQLMILAFRNLGYDLKVSDLGLEVKDYKLG